MSYATIADLAAYMSTGVASLPSDADRLLNRASELVDFATLERVNLRSTEEVSAACQATCAQVEYWIVNGETDLSPALKSKTVGKVSMSFAVTDRGSAGDDLCPRARRCLWREGLLQRRVALR